jgi:lactoylglutathione lyase
MDVLHTAIDVTDLEAQAGFYEELLGLTHSREFEANGVRNYYVKGEGPAELQFRVVEEKDAPAGLNHIPIAVEDVEATVAAAVEDWGSEVIMEPRAVADDRPIAFVSVPEGYAVELIGR